MNFNEDLYLAVIIANIAGHLEAKEIIYVPDDENLTHVVCQIANEFENDSQLRETRDIFNYADRRLREIYEETLPENAPWRFLDQYGEMHLPTENAKED